MLTLCAFQIFWGRIYTLSSSGTFSIPFDSPKSVYILAILVFEVGSAICGAAPSSAVFIFGRAIAGLGSAGIMNGGIVVMMTTVPLQKRPMLQGLIGAVFGVASVAGPLLGGVFTEKVSWRWCFYINLPLGAIAVAILILILHFPKPKTEVKEQKSKLEQLKGLNPISMLIFVCAIVCLILALQWGGTTYDWSNWRIILLFVFFSVLVIVFFAIQIMFPESATLPIRLITQRSIAAGFLFTFTIQSAMLTVTYYIPLFFQTVKNFSPLDSGLATLPFLLALVIGSILAGGFVQRIGIPAPFMIASTILAIIGAALITTWPINVHQGQWIGYQVLFGFGVGIGMQQPNMMAQIVLPKKEQPLGIALMFFGQNLGGAIFVSVAQNVFTDRLAQQLRGIPGLNMTKKEIVETGATLIKYRVPHEWLGAVLTSYRIAIRSAFYVGLGLAAVSVIGAVAIEWRSTKGTAADKSAASKEKGQKTKAESAV